MATSFSGGRTRREPPTMGKQLVNFITCGCESSAPFLAHLTQKGHVRYCHHLASVVRLYKVLYKVSSFRPIPPANMAAKGNSCFWLANVKKIFSSETAWPNGAKYGRKHLCKILYKTSSFGSIRPTNMATVTKNRTYGKIACFW